MPTSTQTLSRQPRCTLVIPTYNAAAFILNTVDTLRDFVHQHPDWCVLFVCDGCADDTAALLSEAIAGDEGRLRAEVYTANRGKGYALRRGLSLADTPYRVFTDVDLAYDLEGPVRLLELLEEGADLAVANRADPGSEFLISPRDFPNIYKRHVMSRAFNWWLRRKLPITILDTQAGLKGITAAAWNRLQSHMTTDGFFFDVELLARAAHAGLHVVETPVRFRYMDPTTVKMLSHGWSMIRDTLRLRKSLRSAPSRRRLRAAEAVSLARQPAVVQPAT